jgi:hypothetical protein
MSAALAVLVRKKSQAHVHSLNFHDNPAAIDICRDRHTNEGNLGLGHVARRRELEEFGEFLHATTWAVVSKLAKTLQKAVLQQSSEEETYIKPETKVPQLKGTPLAPGDAQAVQVESIGIDELKPREGISEDSFLEERGKEVRHGRSGTVYLSLDAHQTC